MTRFLEYEDLYAIPMVSDPQLSPDGTRAAFVVTKAVKEKDTSTGQIWVVPADGSAPPRKLTTGDRDSTPRWSPDGRWLAFVAARGEKAKPQVWLLPTDGGEATVLTSATKGAGAPVWSPDSKRIAFVSTVDDGPDEEDPAVKNR